MMFQHRPVTGTCWGGYLTFVLEGSKLLNKVRKGEERKENGSWLQGRCCEAEDLCPRANYSLSKVKVARLGARGRGTAH